MKILKVILIFFISIEASAQLQLNTELTNQNTSILFNDGTATCSNFIARPGLSINGKNLDQLNLKFDNFSLSGFVNVEAQLDTQVNPNSNYSKIGVGAKGGYGVSASLNIHKDRYFNIEYIKSLVTAYYSIGLQGNDPVGMKFPLSSSYLESQNIHTNHKVTIQYFDMSGSLIKSLSFTRKINVGLFAPNETILNVTFKNDISCSLVLRDFKLNNENFFTATPQSAMNNFGLNPKVGATVIIPIESLKKGTGH
ncbi:hypothetical protein N9N67_00160 [Bacteriovoracaceae bacterium]|nr:hypothetical protein [Bacteriovoracaceae bacterium]